MVDKDAEASLIVLVLETITRCLKICLVHTLHTHTHTCMFYMYQNISVLHGCTFISDVSPHPADGNARGQMCKITPSLFQHHR